MPPFVKRFDQRAVALVELRGTLTECEMFEGALADRGWPVLEKRGVMASTVTERRFWYTIEARFPGSSINAVRGARERIELISDELVLDLNVEVVDRVVRDPLDRPSWYAYDRPVIRPHTVQLPRRTRWAEQWSMWCAETLGLRDTGRLISAVTPSAAQNLAARPLPGAPPQPPRVAARRSGGAGPQVRANLGTRRMSNRRLGRLLALFMIMMWTGARIADLWSQGVGSWWVFGIIAFGLTWAMAAVIRQEMPGTRTLTVWAAAGALGVMAVCLGTNAVLSSPTAGSASQVFTYLITGYVTFNGIRLLVRQWSWQRTAPWLLPALLPVFFAFVPAAGLGLHTFYLDAFGLDLEDVEIPRAYQIAAALKLLGSMSAWLFALSLLGYMKHFHRYVKDRLMGNAVLVVTTFFLLVLGTLDSGVMPAAQAGMDAVEAARDGRTPGSYYGVAPEWVCARPIGKAEAVPVDGAEYVPARPYLKVGDAGGIVVLWDAEEGQALKMPMSRLRIVPENPRPESCG